MTSAKVVLDSLIKSHSGKMVRVTTMNLRYWRGIHSEFMTHRQFSRNASSSRATPYDVMRDINSDYVPSVWRTAAKGMQPGEEFSITESEELTKLWREAKDRIVEITDKMHKIGLAKEQINRLLEPFMYINVLVTSTEWDNFWNLRCHQDAQLEIRELANLMKGCYDSSIPVARLHHLPYVDYSTMYRSENKNIFYKASVARCARVSYLTREGKEPNMLKDLELFERLITSKPMHASPAEHQVMGWQFYDKLTKEGKLPILAHDKLNGNLRKGLIQYRKLLENLPV